MNKYNYIYQKNKYITNKTFIGGSNILFNENYNYLKKNGCGLIYAHGLCKSDSNIQFCIIPDNMIIRVETKYGQSYAPDKSINIVIKILDILQELNQYIFKIINIDNLNDLEQNILSSQIFDLKFKNNLIEKLQNLNTNQQEIPNILKDLNEYIILLQYKIQEIKYNVLYYFNNINNNNYIYIIQFLDKLFNELFDNRLLKSILDETYKSKLIGELLNLKKNLEKDFIKHQDIKKNERRNEIIPGFYFNYYYPKYLIPDILLNFNNKVGRERFALSGVITRDINDNEQFIDEKKKYPDIYEKMFSYHNFELLPLSLPNDLNSSIYLSQVLKTISCNLKKQENVDLPNIYILHCCRNIENGNKNFNLQETLEEFCDNENNENNESKQIDDELDISSSSIDYLKNFVDHFYTIQKNTTYVNDNLITTIKEKIENNNHILKNDICAFYKKYSEKLNPNPNQHEMNQL